MLLRSSVATNGEEPLRKKKASLIDTTISSLPDDLVLSCLARVSRLYYPTLSLVSKKFRSLIASSELYKVRSLLGLTERCLYVCFWIYGDFNPRWYTLHWRPHTTRQNNSSEHLLVPIPSPHCTQSRWASVVAIGSSIYSIGGDIDSKPSSSVSVLDCRFHSWHQAPNMLVERSYAAANVIDGKIYIVNYNSSYWVEVFNPKTQIWNSTSSLGHEICSSKIITISTVIDGKICMYHNGKGLAYNPKDGTCEPIEWDMCQGWIFYSHCVIDNVLICYTREQGFTWFETKTRLWRNLKGLEGMRKITKHTTLKFVDYGGKIAVLWEKYVSSAGCGNKEIWCAVIAVERRNNEEEIWGTVEWHGVVLTVPTSYEIEHVLASTL